MPAATALLLFGLLSASPLQAQNLPSAWNRDRDWVPQKNPGPDSLGNLVWSHLYRKGRSTGVGRWGPQRGGSWSRSGNGNASTINRLVLYHQCYRDYTGSAHVWSPMIRFTNATKTAFQLKIGGKLRVSWPPIAGTTRWATQRLPSKLSPSTSGRWVSGFRSARQPPPMIRLPLATCLRVK